MSTWSKCPRCGHDMWRGLVGRPGRWMRGCTWCRTSEPVPPRESTTVELPEPAPEEVPT